MNDYGKLLDEINRLRAKKTELEKEIKTLEKQSATLQSSNSRILEEFKPVDDRIKNLRSMELELNASLNQLRTLINKEKDRLKSIEVERTQALQEVESKKDEISQLLVELDQKNLSVKEQLKAVDSKRSELGTQMSLFQLRVDEFNKNFKLKITKLEEEQKKLEKDKETIIKCNRELQDQQRQLNTKSALLGLQEKELSKLKSDLERQWMDVNKKDKEITTKKEELLNWEQELQQLSMSLSTEKNQVEKQKKEAELDGLRVEKLAREKGVEKELKELRTKLMSFVLVFCLMFSSTVKADDEVTVDGGSDIQARKNSVLFYEKASDPSNPFADGIKLYAKDKSGTTTLYTKDSAGTVTEVGAGGGGGGSGDITSVGDVTSGAAFDGTQGTTLTFYNAGGNGTLSYNGSNFALSSGKGLTWNSASSSLSSSGGIALAAGTTTGTQLSVTSNSLTSGTGILSTSSSASMTGRMLRAIYTGTSSGNAIEAQITSASASGTALQIDQYGTGNALTINDVSGDATPLTVDASGNLSVGGTFGVTGALTGNFDAGGATFEIPNSTSLPGTCTVGQVYMDTDATSGQMIYACESTNTWALQGDGGGGGSGDITAVGSMTTGAAFADSTADDDWLGLGVAAGRIEFDDQTNDEVNIISPLVGINTSTPSAPLHIYSSGAANETVAGFKIQRSDTNNIAHLQHYFAGISYLSNNLYRDVSSVWDLDLDTDTGVALILDSRASQGYFAVYTAPATVGTLTPTERFRVTNAGRVGIGTTGPDVDLDVNNASGGALQLTYNDSNGGAATNVKLQVNSSGHLAITPSGSGISVTDDDWLGLGSAAGRIEFDDQSTDELNILNSRLGIGTSAPTSLIHGVATAAGSTRESILYATTTDANSLDGFAIGNATSTDNIFSPMFIGRSNSTSMTGLTFRAVIPTASDTGTVPILQFQMNLDSTADLLNGTVSSVATRPLWRFLNGNTTVQQVDVNGNMGIKTSSPGETLDINDSDGGSIQLTYNDSDGSAANKVVMQVNSSGNLNINPSGGEVGIGNTAPAYKLEVGNLTAGANTTFSAATGAVAVSDSGNSTKFIGENTGADGASSGSFVALVQNDGTAVASGNRLGGLQMGGYDGVDRTRLGAGVIAYADETYSATSVPTYMSFETAASGSTTRTEKLKIGSSTDSAVTINNVMTLTPQASVPASPVVGMIYVDSTPTPDALCFYNGSDWDDISAAATDANCA